MLALALTGCSAAAAPGTPPSTGDASPTDLPAGVTVAVTQLRSDVADRQAQVQVRNGSDAPIEIGAVRLDDPRFAAPANRVVDRTSTLAPGAAVNVRVQLAGPACDAPDEATSTVTIDFATADDRGTATAPAAEVFPFLAELHRRDCVAEEVAAVADIGLSGFAPSPPGRPATLLLTIDPVPGADAELALTGIRETNLLTYTEADGGALALDVTLAGGRRDAQAIALPLLPARCDPHAVQEDKRGTVFTLDVLLDGEVGQVTLAADADLKAELLAWVTAWCADS